MNTVVNDRQAILTVGTPVEEVAGVKDVTVSLPHLVGGRGILATFPLPLNQAEQEKLSARDVYISGIIADEGPFLQRYRAATMGRATPVRHRTAHIKVELDQVERPEEGGKPEEAKKEEKEPKAEAKAKAPAKKTRAKKTTKTKKKLVGSK